MERRRQLATKKREEKRQGCDRTSNRTDCEQDEERRRRMIVPKTMKKNRGGLPPRPAADRDERIEKFRREAGSQRHVATDRLGY